MSLKILVDDDRIEQVPAYKYSGAWNNNWSRISNRVAYGKLRHIFRSSKLEQKNVQLVQRKKKLNLYYSSLFGMFLDRTEFSYGQIDFMALFMFYCLVNPNVLIHVFIYMNSGEKSPFTDQLATVSPNYSAVNSTYVVAFEMTLLMRSRPR